MSSTPSSTASSASSSSSSSSSGVGTGSFDSGVDGVDSGSTLLGGGTGNSVITSCSSSSSSSTPGITSLASTGGVLSAVPALSASSTSSSVDSTVAASNNTIATTVNDNSVNNCFFQFHPALLSAAAAAASVGDQLIVGDHHLQLQQHAQQQQKHRRKSVASSLPSSEEGGIFSSLGSEQKSSATSGTASEDGADGDSGDDDDTPPDCQPGDVVHDIRCGLLTAKLHMKRFICPGIHRKCVEIDGKLISPRQFTIRAEKDKQKDWKGSIRLGRYNLRTLMEQKQLDFWEHAQNCSLKCQSRNYIKNRRVELQMQQQQQQLQEGGGTGDTNQNTSLNHLYHTTNNGPSTIHQQNGVIGGGGNGGAQPSAFPLTMNFGGKLSINNNGQNRFNNSISALDSSGEENSIKPTTRKSSVVLEDYASQTVGSLNDHPLTLAKMGLYFQPMKAEVVDPQDQQPPSGLISCGSAKTTGSPPSAAVAPAQQELLGSAVGTGSPRTQNSSASFLRLGGGNGGAEPTNGGTGIGGFLQSASANALKIPNINGGNNSAPLQQQTTAAASVLANIRQLIALQQQKGAPPSNGLVPGGGVQSNSNSLRHTPPPLSSLGAGSLFGNGGKSQQFPPITPTAVNGGNGQLGSGSGAGTGEPQQQQLALAFLLQSLVEQQREQKKMAAGGPISGPLPPLGGGSGSNGLPFLPSQGTVNNTTNGPTANSSSSSAAFLQHLAALSALQQQQQNGGGGSSSGGASGSSSLSSSLGVVVSQNSSNGGLLTTQAPATEFGTSNQQQQNALTNGVSVPNGTNAPSSTGPSMLFGGGGCLLNGPTTSGPPTNGNGGGVSKPPSQHLTRADTDVASVRRVMETQPVLFWSRMRSMGLFDDMLALMQTAIDQIRQIYTNGGSAATEEFAARKLSNVALDLDLAAIYGDKIYNRYVQTALESSLLTKELQELQRRTRERERRLETAKRKSQAFDQILLTKSAGIGDQPLGASTSGVGESSSGNGSTLPNSTAVPSQQQQNGSGSIGFPSSVPSDPGQPPDFKKLHLSGI